MNKKERITSAFNYLRFKGIAQTYTDVAESIGSTLPNVSAAMNGKEKNLTDNFIKRFVKAYPVINANWLLTGEGQMLNEQSIDTTDSDEDVTIVPLLPIAAQAGSLSYFAESVQLRDCERIISPIKGADYAMRVSGDSMSPEYPNGSQVLIKKIDPSKFIDWGKVFVLDTYNGTVMKQLAPGSHRDRVKCISKNPDPVYAPFEVMWDDVIGVYRVLMCMSVK